MASERKPLEGDEIVIHIPKGSAEKITIVEEDTDLPTEIAVRVSRGR